MEKISKIHIFILLSLVCLTTSCMKDDDFSSSTSDLLSFSTDTVKLDTCFSKVPTPTKTFWVHNYTDKSIRCSTVSLEGGNQTGFRVNVDGVYLGASQGYFISDQEIRKGDSIRVFVELTSPINGSDKPELVTDNIIFDLESGARQKVNLCAYSWDADFYKDYVLTENMTLSGTRPTVIYGNLTVPKGLTLNIAAGKTLYFHDSSCLEIYGTLISEGKQGNEVVLRGDRLDNMFDYLKYDGVSGQWGGIHFNTSSYGNRITYTDLHAATDAIVCDSSDVSLEKLGIDHSIVHNNKGYGILSTNSNIKISNTQITNNLHSCVEVRGGEATIDFCTLAQFYPFDASRGSALEFTNYDELYDYNLTKMDVRNTLITGYADDVVNGSKSDSTTTFMYSFDHCLMRTPEVEDSVNFHDIIWEDPADTICGGTKNFEMIDTDLLRYNFHLSDKSLAIDAATPVSGFPDDREGTLRDDKPAIGCFEKNHLNEE